MKGAFWGAIELPTTSQGVPRPMPPDPNKDREHVVQWRITVGLAGQFRRGPIDARAWKERPYGVITTDLVALNVGATMR